ncbi:MAG: isoleucine--tRNA ligase [Bdellovibrionales bacterium]
MAKTSADSLENIYEPVRPDINIPQKEEETLRFWNERKIFEKSLKQTEHKPFYSFYDGPPFATGLPHYGHLLAGTLKDIVPRYWTMQGYHVPRRFGWDCHGLPVEYEIDKSLKIESRKQVLAMGVDKYNDACRSIVQRYAQEWKQTVNRVGRWVDMDNAYFTMDPKFMESVWWVFKQLWDKGLIYEGYKVVPYSTGISTALSNFEANLNYKEVQDPAITVAFQLKSEPNTSILAWTTTPWTLPSNLALAVREDIEYVKVKVLKTGKQYVLAKELLKNYPELAYSEELLSAKPKKDKAPVELPAQLVQELTGKDLLELKYEPLFPYFADMENAFRVIPSGHVTTESGTGVVHMAPAYGEDDFYACKKAGIAVVNPVDDDGMFTKEIPDFVGRRVKEADKDLIALLKKSDKLFRHDTLTHSYPFCWRTNTPLIYRAVANWFVKVEAIKDTVIASNKKTEWVPETIRDGRFGNWLEGARDWAISRSRFWGTPIPVWKNEEGEMICVGSIEELAKLSGKTLTDLHKQFVDPIEIPSPTGKSPLKRIPDVLDCWFESGSMPYAQWGYPQTNKEKFEKSFPADFIAEGLDQTRGWFYTLTIIGAALFGRSPFKHVVVNGIIVAEDGKKMSKSLRNYPDPKEVLDKHGADALRLYMIDSPVVKAQELRFSEKGVHDIVRRIMLRWWNSYSFFVNYANIDKFIPRGDAYKSPNLLDQWVLSRLNTLTEYTNQEMKAYRLYNVVPGLLSFIEDLTNTYIRFNRSHFWQDGMPEDKRLAYETLHEVLMTLSRLMAPFTPFMAETIYKNLSRSTQNSHESVHLDSYPEGNEKMKKPKLEAAVQRMSQLVMMGRNLREQFGVKAKIPLKTLRIIHRDTNVLNEIKKLEMYIRDELNVREIVYDTGEEKYVDITAKAQFPVLGPRFGPKMKTVAQAIATITKDQILALESGETLTLAGESITSGDVEIRRSPKKEFENLSTHQLITIEMDKSVEQDQIREGLSREIIRRIQMARKSAQLNLDDRIQLEIFCDGELKDAVEHHKDRIQSETLALDLKLTAKLSHQHQENTDIDGQALGLAFSCVNK